MTTAFFEINRNLATCEELINNYLIKTTGEIRVTEPVPGGFIEPGQVFLLMSKPTLTQPAWSYEVLLSLERIRLDQFPPNASHEILSETMPWMSSPVLSPDISLRLFHQRQRPVAVLFQTYRLIAEPFATRYVYPRPMIIEANIRDYSEFDLTEDQVRERLNRIMELLNCCTRTINDTRVEMINSGSIRTGIQVPCSPTPPPPEPPAPPSPPEEPDAPVDTTGDYVNEKLADVELITHIRDVSINIVGEGLRPNADLHVFVEGENVNKHVIPSSDEFSPKQEGVVRTDSSGRVEFVLDLPAGSFRTGKLTIIAIDEPNNRQEDATTWATGVFHASGLRRSYETDIVSIRPPEVTVNTNVQVNLPPPPQDIGGEGGGDGGGDGGSDPLAQTFMVPADKYPDGIFVTSVDLFINEVPEENIPMKVELRTVVNGFPSAKEILPFSEVFVYPKDIRLPASTDSLRDILEARTRVHFKAPVYLKAGSEYALVLKSASTKYRTFLSKMGQAIIGTDRVLREQPTLGSLFKSQNARAWTPFQDEDLIFVLNRAEFDTSSSLVVRTNNVLSPTPLMRYVNEVLVSPDVMSISGSVDYSFDGSMKLRNQDGFTSFKVDPGKYHKFQKEHECLKTGDFKLTITGRSKNPHVSPVVMPNTSSATYVKNIINNMGITPTGLRIIDPGRDYTSKPTITVEGGGGSGAKLEVGEIRDGQIWSVVIVDPGRGYTSKPTIIVEGGGGSGAVIEFDRFETSPGIGNAKAKYIHRPIQLVDDFAARGVRVTIDINRPKQTDVRVYVKARHEADPRTIDEIPWREVPEVGDKVFNDDAGFTETVWELSDLSYEFDGTTYNECHEIVTKVVMLSDNTCKFPRLRDFRAVTII